MFWLTHAEIDFQAIMSESDNLHNSHGIQPTEALLQMIVAPWVSRAIYVAAELGIADSLRGYGIKSGQIWDWQPWGYLLETIKTGLQEVSFKNKVCKTKTFTLLTL